MFKCPMCNATVPKDCRCRQQPSEPLAASSPPAWEPIDNQAPRDTWVLVSYEAASGPRVTLGIWKRHGFNGIVRDYWLTDIGEVEPTHWMPLPLPPAPKEPT